MTADSIPSRAGLDRSAGLRLDGYDFAPRRRRRWGSGARPADNAVELRMLGQRTVLVGGPDAVRFFYDPDRFRRAGSIPGPLKNTLFGRGTIHVQDGDVHRLRKRMFLDLLDQAASRDLAAVADGYWQAATERWADGGRVVLFDEAVRVIGVAVCRWAGLPLTPANARRRVRDLETIVDGFGGVGPRHLRARLARKRSESWVEDVVRDVRAGDREVPAGSAVAVVAAHRGPDGALLDEHTAAVELLNIVRPTVAVSWFVAFAALALHENPQWRERLAAAHGQGTDASPDGDLEAFVHEVRRVYPFAPLVGARARRTFTWRGHTFPEGRLVLLDLHGTNHDPQLWPDPDTFDPTRFLGREPDPFTFVPQGGGDPAAGHRCAGERVTVELLKGAVRVLTGLRYTLPEQDLSYPLSRIPTRPRSGVVLADVRPA